MKLKKESKLLQVLSKNITKNSQKTKLYKTNNNAKNIL